MDDDGLRLEHGAAGVTRRAWPTVAEATLRRWFPEAEIVRGRDLGALNLRAAVIGEDHLAHVLAFTSRRDIRGLITDHRRPDSGKWCAGSAWFAGYNPPAGVNAWTVEAESPLTLAPSLACKQCPVHGFIRAGIWIPA